MITFNRSIIGILFLFCFITSIYALIEFKLIEFLYIGIILLDLGAYFLVTFFTTPKINGIKIIFSDKIVISIIGLIIISFFIEKNIFNKNYQGYDGIALPFSIIILTFIMPFLIFNKNIKNKMK